MTDGPDLSAACGSGFREDDSAESLASRVLYVIASRVSNAIEKIDSEIAQTLSDAVLGRNARDPAGIVSLLTGRGISESDITDLYVPFVARELGTKWEHDDAAFTDVTIAVARLQGVLREVNCAWPNQATLSLDAPAVLMVVPEGEAHTLGALVATGQLRRAGASVQLCVGEAPEVAMGLVERNDYDLVMVSTGRTEGLEPLRRLIQNLRYSMQVPAPIVVGGPVVGVEEDMISLTRADMVTDRPTEALSLCMKQDAVKVAQKRA